MCVKVANTFQQKSLYVFFSQQGVVIAASKPTLPKLMQLGIPQEVGAHYQMFGIHLLQDQTGAQIGAIVMSCHYQPVAIVTEILKQWLQREPTPVTWDNLIQVFRQCGLERLAQHVQEML